MQRLQSGESAPRPERTAPSAEADTLRVPLRLRPVAKLAGRWLLKQVPRW